jgi:hypothetical protein
MGTANFKLRLGKSRCELRVRSGEGVTGGTLKMCYDRYVKRLVSNPDDELEVKHRKRYVQHNIYHSMIIVGRRGTRAPNSTRMTISYLQ